MNEGTSIQTLRVPAIIKKFLACTNQTDAQTAILNAPVAGEPSLGTSHFRSQNASYVINAQAMVANSWYTATFAGLPTGTKVVLAAVTFVATAGSRALVWRPYNNGQTVAQSYDRTIGTNPAANVGFTGLALMVVDSSGRVDIGQDGTGTLYVNNWVFYWE